MSDRNALIISCIIERQLCLACIAERSRVSEERAAVALKSIRSALVLSSQADRCATCGETTTVHSVGRRQPL
jgi:uncharacterized protein with PIN domain